MNKVEHGDESLGRQVSFGGEVEQEVHDSVAHVDVVNGTHQIGFLILLHRFHISLIPDLIPFNIKLTNSF